MCPPYWVYLELSDTFQRRDESQQAGGESASCGGRPSLILGLGRQGAQFRESPCDFGVTRARPKCLSGFTSCFQRMGTSTWVSPVGGSRDVLTSTG